MYTIDVNRWNFWFDIDIDIININSFDIDIININSFDIDIININSFDIDTYQYWLLLDISDINIEKSAFGSVQTNNNWYG